jgi:hypothetical protein
MRDPRLRRCRVGYPPTSGCRSRPTTIRDGEGDARVLPLSRATAGSIDRTVPPTSRHGESDVSTLLLHPRWNGDTATARSGAVTIRSAKVPLTLLPRVQASMYAPGGEMEEDGTDAIIPPLLDIACFDEHYYVS